MRDLTSHLSDSLWNLKGTKWYWCSLYMNSMAKVDTIYIETIITNNKRARIIVSQKRPNLNQNFSFHEPATKIDFLRAFSFVTKKPELMISWIKWEWINLFRKNNIIWIRTFRSFHEPATKIDFLRASATKKPELMISWIKWERINLSRQ